MKLKRSFSATHDNAIVVLTKMRLDRPNIVLIISFTVIEAKNQNMKSEKNFIGGSTLSLQFIAVGQVTGTIGIVLMNLMEATTEKINTHLKCCSIYECGDYRFSVYTMLVKKKPNS